jgi:beta-lactamase class A
MTTNLTRRRALLSVATLPLLPACVIGNTSRVLQDRFATLEQALQGRLGVAAFDPLNRKWITYRSEERFALCSTFKMMASAAVLARSVTEPQLLASRIHYSEMDLVTYSPVTEKHVVDGMTVEELCAATMIYSDNCAGNLLLDQLGGPAALTRFARNIGDKEFRLDRRETELNTAIPGDPRDTTTPRAMALSLQSLVLGNSLPHAERQKLKEWLLACATGGKTIRAGVPSDWTIGNKTGSGGFGSRNDIGILWSRSRPPIVLAVYTTQHKKDASSRDDVVAAAARIVVETI